MSKTELVALRAGFYPAVAEAGGGFIVYIDRHGAVFWSQGGTWLEMSHFPRELGPIKVGRAISFAECDEEVVL